MRQYERGMELPIMYEQSHAMEKDVGRYRVRRAVMLMAESLTLGDHL